MQRILLINGPNLNLLGQREPERYGHKTLDDVISALESGYSEQLRIESVQSASEAELVSRVHQTHHDGTDMIIINPGAFTHTSVALRDALLSVGTPFIELHISNVYAREAFRHHSYFSDLAVAVLAGAGTDGYRLAIEIARSHLSQELSNRNAAKG